jgi:hypothetical protein
MMIFFEHLLTLPHRTILTANVRVALINLVGNGQGPDRSYHPVAALAL